MFFVCSCHVSYTYEQNIPRWASTHNRLLSMTADVDYDVDSYAQQLEEAVTENLDVLAKFKERISCFRSQLAEEELMSKRIIKK